MEYLEIKATTGCDEQWGFQSQNEVPNRKSSCLTYQLCDLGEITQPL